MATHDYVISNASGAAVRADLNNALAAIVSNNSNATAPATTYSYQWWADTTAGQLKLRNAANDDWIVIQELDGTMLMEDGSAASPGLAFASDLDTGLLRPGTNSIAISTAGNQRVVVDASGQVGIGETTPGTLVEIGSTAPYVTLKNSTQEDTSGGRESKIIFEGEQSGGEITSLAEIEVSHEGTADDQKGQLILKVNSGAEGASPGEKARVDSAGRLLVGTSSESGSSTVVVRGRPGVSAAEGQLELGRNQPSTTPFGAGDPIGKILFTDNGANVYGQVVCEADGTSASGDYPGRLVFSTTAAAQSSPTEAFRVTKLQELTFAANSSWNIRSVRPSGSNQGHIEFQNGASNVGFISTSTTNTSYNTSSDYRLKENVVNISDGITRVKQLLPRRFNFIIDADKTVDGFIAHEAQAVVPEAVIGTKDATKEEEYEVTPAVLNDDGEQVTPAVMGTRTVPDHQAIDQSKLVPLLTAALQEAIAKIETLETKVAALEAG